MKHARIPTTTKFWAHAVVLGLTPAALAACGEPAAHPSADASSSGSQSVSGTGGSASNGSVSGAGGATAAGGSAAGTSSSGGAGGGGAGGTAATSGGAGGTGSGGSSGAGAGGGGAGGSAGAGGGGAGGTGGTCPLELVGFATVDGGTTGGGNATPTTVTTQAQLRDCATDDAPRVCRVQGTLTFSPFEEIDVASDKTIIGVGANAEIVMGGFFLDEGINNVIIRNLTIRDSYIEGQDEEDGDGGGDRDGVQMDTAHHVWIDHCRFTHLGDGLIDSRMDTTFETVSWNILENHNKTFGIGWTENVTAQITIHHNWIRDTNQRNPSTDNVLRAHLFNNLLENVTSYGNYARGGTNMVLENSVFVDVNNPYYYDTGSLVAIGNSTSGSTSGQMETSGSSYSFFDPSDFYDYTLDPVAEVAELLESCAGPRAELGI